MASYSQLSYQVSLGFNCSETNIKLGDHIAFISRFRSCLVNVHNKTTADIGPEEFIT